MRRRGVSLWAVALVYSATAYAQYPERALSQYSERLYSTDSGLPQNEIRSIAQTPDGYLWFGTRDGLARFDGVRFTVFRRETTPGLGHNMFGALLVDRSGKLWVATANGLSCYEHGAFKRYTDAEGLPSNAIHSLLEDRSGRLWVGTWNGLAVFDGRRFHAFSVRDGLPDNSISGLAEDGAGGLWIGTYGGGLAHMSGGRFTMSTEKDGLPSNVVLTVLRDRAGRLWAGTLRGSALLAASGRFDPIRDLPGESICFFEDRRGDVWAATDQVFARLRREPGAVFLPEDGPAPHVETIFEDREDSLWVGTYAAGVARYRGGPFISYGAREGLPAGIPQTVFEDSKRNVWVGSANGLSCRSRGVFKTIPRFNSSVQSMAEDADGRIWVATDKGIALFQGRVRRQLVSREHIPVEVHVLYADREGRMWIGSPEGVAIWDRGRVTKLNRRDGLPGDYVMSILEDRAGTMWVGTVSGLASVSGGKITSYGPADGLLSAYIQCIYQDSENTIWVCTPSGLHRFKNGRFRAIAEKDGMFSDSVLEILEDGRRRFWIGSYRGVFRVDKADVDAFADGLRSRVESVAYGREDGMKSAVCGGMGVQPAGWKARDGTLWFPAEDGVVSVDPSSSLRQYPPPDPLLEAVFEDGVAAAGSSVKPEVRRIEFLFTAPTSIAPESVEFRYRMLGFEDQWREAGARRLISFTSLPPGSYRFVVSARRRGGSWSEAAVLSSPRVLPHFYETAWFYGGSGLLVVLFLWSIHSLRVQQTEQRLQAVMAERSRVAQELHDTLLQSLSGTAMQIQAGLRRLRGGALEGGLEQLSSALAHMGRSMAEARQAIWDLNSPDLQELPLARALEAAGGRVCAGGPRLSFAVSGFPKPLPECIEKHVYRVGVEAISNAVRHSGCTEIFAGLEYGGESIVLRVRDNGCGFEVPRNGSAAAGNHWGLRGMAERAKQCNGRFAMESAPGAGAEIRFEAPI